MDELTELINEIFMAVYQIAPPEVQKDLVAAKDKYVESQRENL